MSRGWGHFRPSRWGQISSSFPAERVPRRFSLGNGVVGSCKLAVLEDECGQDGKPCGDLSIHLGQPLDRRGARIGTDSPCWPGRTSTVSRSRPGPPRTSTGARLIPAVSIAVFVASSTSATLALIRHGCPLLERSVPLGWRYITFTEHSLLIAQQNVSIALWIQGVCPTGLIGHVANQQPPPACRRVRSPHQG